MNGLTVTAAALGSPALARVCSHPAFAGTALLVGASTQAHAWAHVGGLLSGALLLLSSVATAVSGYSFYRGFKAGWQALKDSSRLAVYGRTKTLQKDVAQTFEAITKTKQHPILADAEKLARENLSDVKAAVTHFEDLRDEKPQRIEAAYLSGLANNPLVCDVISPSLRQAADEAVAVTKTSSTPVALYSKLPELFSIASKSALGGKTLEDLVLTRDNELSALKQGLQAEIAKALKACVDRGMPLDDAKHILQKMADASSAAVDRARRSAQALVRGEKHLLVQERLEEARREALEAARKAYLTSRLIPATLSRIREPMDPQTSASVRTLIERTGEIERLLETTVRDNAVINRWSLLRSADKAQNLKATDYVRQQTQHAIESQRVASASPRNWVSEAIGDPTYSPAEKAAGRFLGRSVNASLRYGVPAVVGMQVISSGLEVFQGQPTAGLWQNLITWGLSLAPMAAAYLYNKRQGSRRFRVSPAPSQKLSLERYGEKTLQDRVSQRLDRAIPPMEDGDRERFIEDTRTMLKRVEADIASLEALAPPSYRSNAPAHISQGKALWNVAPARRFSPHGTPNPNRRYAYDHEPGGPDTAEKRMIRKATKAMPLHQLDDAIRRGDVTHVDILNMICDHPAATDGAVFPRPISGKLKRELYRLAREADTLGVIRHFVAVKDLFPGVDGVVTAGSKTTYFEDLGPSPLVQKILETDIPIPCGLTAGANGGSGLYNGHGAVGNPNAPGFDTAGSSSACAYLLSLEDMPIRLAVGTDTGGSISAPCGAAKLFGWVPEKGLLSTVNMIPFATHLDTPGIMGVDRDEVLAFAKQITLAHHLNHYQAPVESPEVYYFKTDLRQVSGDSQTNFARQLSGLRDKGFTVTELDEKFSAIRQIPLDLYLDSYVAAAFTLMNPLEDNWMEPQRYILDRNLQNRLAKANALLKASDKKHGNLFNRFLDLHVRFRNVLQRKFANASVFATPSPEAVALDDFRPNGSAGAKLDSHDILGGMLKNRTDRALLVDRDRRLVVEGRTGDVLAVSQGYNRTFLESKLQGDVTGLFPTLAGQGYQGLVDLLAKKALETWESNGSPSDSWGSPASALNDALQKNLHELFRSLQNAGKQELLDALRRDAMARRDQRPSTSAPEPKVAA